MSSSDASREVGCLFCSEMVAVIFTFRKYFRGGRDNISFGVLWVDAVDAIDGAYEIVDLCCVVVDTTYQ